MKRKIDRSFEISSKRTKLAITGYMSDHRLTYGDLAKMLGYESQATFHSMYRNERMSYVMLKRLTNLGFKKEDFLAVGDYGNEPEIKPIPDTEITPDLRDLIYNVCRKAVEDAIRDLLG